MRIYGDEWLTVSCDGVRLSQVEAILSLPGRNLSVGELCKELRLLVIYEVSIVLRKVDLKTTDGCSSTDLLWRNVSDHGCIDEPKCIHIFLMAAQGQSRGGRETFFKLGKCRGERWGDEGKMKERWETAQANFCHGKKVTQLFRVCSMRNFFPICQQKPGWFAYSQIW